MPEDVPEGVVDLEGIDDDDEDDHEDLHLQDAQGQDFPLHDTLPPAESQEEPESQRANAAWSSLGEKKPPSKASGSNGEKFYGFDPEHQFAWRSQHDDGDREYAVEWEVPLRVMIQ